MVERRTGWQGVVGPVQPHRLFISSSSLPFSSMSQNAILARILSSNNQWAKDVEQSEPGFFANCAKGQAPKVCVFHANAVAHNQVDGRNMPKRK
jgi:hypothetical protein